MYCDKCGFENWENSKFCRKCGNRLTPAKDNEEGQPQHIHPKSHSPKIQRNRTPLFIVVTAVLIAAVGFGIFILNKTRAADTVESENTEETELYLPVERVYTSKYGDEEEETTWDKYRYYFDGLTVYSYSDNELQITTYKEDGSTEEVENYRKYSDDDISHSLSTSYYNAKGQEEKYEYTYDNVYSGKHHRSSSMRVYEYSENDSTGKLVEINKSENEETIDVAFVLDENNRIVKQTETGPNETIIYEYQYNDQGNQIQFRYSTYENDSLTYYDVHDYEYNEDGGMVKSVYKSYREGKLTHSNTIEYSDNYPYVSSYHSVGESTYSDGTTSTSVYDSLTNYAKAVIRNGEVVPAESSSFREMDESELNEAKKIIAQFEELAENAE